MSDSASPSSLRGLYTSPTDNWTFLPAVEPKNATSPTGKSFQWESAPSSNPRSRVFDLPPDLHDNHTINIRLALKRIFASALLQYAGTAIAMPFEVGKTLLQVQYVPKDSPQALDANEVEMDYELEEATHMSDTSEESYFADPSGSASTSTRFVPDPKPRITDEEGYLVRRSIVEDGMRPAYVIPIGAQEGVWGMAKRVGRWNSEGWLALWKGQLTSCVIEVATSTIQPFIHSILINTLLPTDLASSLPVTQAANPKSVLLLTLTSHLITGIIVSPLDLIRTRLIVQSSVPQHRAYSGPVDAFKSILSEEGGLYNMYFHPTLLVPTVLDFSVRTLCTLTAPLVISRTFGISDDSHPFAYSLADFACSSASLLFVLPIETIRRRLQIQSRGGRQIETCVETQPRPYAGFSDALWRILTEEQSKPPRRRRRRSSKAKETAQEVVEDKGWFQATGIAQLYRGFGMGVSASAIVFMLSLMVGREEPDAGWAEL